MGSCRNDRLGHPMAHGCQLATKSPSSDRSTSTDSPSSAAQPWRLWGAAATIYVVIAQLVGADYTTTAVAYFRQFILPAVGLLIGLALLAYHWSIIRRDAARRAPTVIPAQAGTHPTPLESPAPPSESPTPESPQLSNTFKYIMSAVGLIALVPGLMGLLITILFLLTEGDVLTPTDDDAETLAVALTMIVVGAPLWLSFWWRVIHADPHSLVRRSYLYVALIALGGTTLITLITLLTEILGQGSGFLDDALILGLSILLPAATFFAYHTLILRQDSHRAPARRSPESGNLEPEIQPTPVTPTTATTPAAEQPPPPAFYVTPAPPYIIPTDFKKN